MGDVIKISGNYENANVNVKSTVTTTKQIVGKMSAVDDNAREELQHSLDLLTQALEQIPASLKEQAEAVASATKMLVDTANAEKPNKTMIEITGDGLKKAAMNLAGVAPTILTIAGEVITGVLRVKGLA